MSVDLALIFASGTGDRGFEDCHKRGSSNMYLLYVDASSFKNRFYACVEKENNSKLICRHSLFSNCNFNN
jgi:hypothetical protein